MKHLLIMFLFIASIFLVACSGPRSATLCISDKTGDWVKCPKGYEPGELIGSKKVEK